MKKKYLVKGMGCASCVNKIEKRLNSLDGVKATVNLSTEKLFLEFDENKYNLKFFEKEINNMGYELIEELEKIDKEYIYLQEVKKIKNKMILSLIFALPLFFLSMGPMIGLEIIKNIKINSYIQFLLALFIIIINYNMISNGLKQLINKTPNMYSLISIGVLSSIFYSIYSLILGNNHLYFESAGLIITFITIGKFLELKTKNKTSNSIKELIKLKPDEAIVLNNDAEKKVSIEDIRVGDLLLIKVGETIPVDGVVIEGVSLIDESMITGESIPVKKEINSKVIGGSINKSSVLKIRAEKVGEDTMLSQIIKYVEEAQMGKSEISKLVDKVTFYFVPTVILLSLFVLITYYIFIGTSSFEYFLSILVIACPCALGLATPTSIMISTGKAAKNGILIRNGEALEKISKIDTIFLDKTGTITKGQPYVNKFINYSKYKNEEILEYVYNIEKYSEHPLSKAIVSYCEKLNFNSLDVKNIEIIVGEGIKGTINNKDISIGNKKIMENLNFDNFEMDFINLSNKGNTIIYISIDKEIVALLSISDEVRESSLEAINKLKNMNIRVIMLTGDNEKTALEIAKKVNVDKVYYELNPNEKLKIIEKYQNEGKFVAMVGDGINDSPALTKSNVGIAIGSGSDIAIESAELILIRNNLLDVVYSIKLSYLTIKNIKENLFWAFIYNSVGIIFATGLPNFIFGLPKLNPMIAALAMSFSSVSVLLNALRLKFIKIK